ncbi:MAG: SDR family oxidoreductase [Alphaproteobacteria bacterium]|nr:SDR family oxidoreductase [Alphaproteobacteria bacterium]
MASFSTDNPNGIAVVTGASTGIGAIYADRLAKRGYDLLLVARDRERLGALADRLQRDAGIAADVAPADLTDHADLAAVEARLRSDQHITMLVNNAGSAVAGAFVDADIDRVETMIRLNVVAPTRLASAVLPGMIARRRGVIVNIASVLALAPERFSGTYSGTKAYMLNLSQSLQHELAGTGVHVQAVLPGATRTEIWSRSGADLASLPAEMVMDADELVDAALLALDRGETVTIPALEPVEEWDALNAARLALGPKLSRNHAATRYRHAIAEPLPA